MKGGAVQSDAVITMEAMTDGTFGFRFGPEGLQFVTPARLEIKADETGLAGVDLSQLTVANARDPVDDWQVIGGVYDAVSHFSCYALCIRN